MRDLHCVDLEVNPCSFCDVLTISTQYYVSYRNQSFVQMAGFYMKRNTWLKWVN